MPENKEKTKGSCTITDCHISWLLFILVAGVIVCALVFFVTDLIREPKVRDIVIRVDVADSVYKEGKDNMVYGACQIDSLVNVVKEYELELDEKYQYLLENRQDDDRFKTWSALIVGIIVSLCGFWGYRSLRDLREDLTKSTEKTTALTVDDYLSKNLQMKVNDALTNSLKSKIVEIIKAHVFDTLNSSDDSIVKNKVAERMESDEFEKKLADVVKEKVEEVVDEMTLNYHREMNPNAKDLKEADGEMQMT